MSFKLKTYQAPDFTQPSLMNAPEARLEPAPFDKVAPDGYHATTIFPSILRLGVSGCWQRKAAWTAWRYLRMGKSMSVNSET